jgi:hypothetical protein
VDGLRSPEAATLARLSGETTARIRIAAAAAPPQRVVLDPDVAPTELRTSGSVTATVSTSEQRDRRGAAMAAPGERLPQAN